MEGAVWIGGVWCGILWLANDVDDNNDDNALWNSDGDDDGYRGGVMEWNHCVKSEAESVAVDIVMELGTLLIKYSTYSIHLYNIHFH